MACITTSITALPTGLVEILAIQYVSTFKTVVILYIQLYILHRQKSLGKNVTTLYFVDKNRGIEAGVKGTWFYGEKIVKANFQPGSKMC